MNLKLTSLFLLLIAVSCKKENDSNLEKISGDYKVYQLVIEDPNDGPQVTPVPAADGSYSKAVVKANNDSSMTVKIYYFSKQNDTLNKESLTGRVVKNTNGDLRFMSGNNWLGTFGKDADVELYPDAKRTLYARK